MTVFLQQLLYSINTSKNRKVSSKDSIFNKEINNIYNKKNNIHFYGFRIIIIDELHVLAYKQQNPSSKSILFVHGAWHGGWCWDNNFLPYFYKKGYSCYALDLRGHGKSKSNGNWRFRFVNLSSYVKDVEKIVNSLLGGDIVVVGHLNKS